MIGPVGISMQMVQPFRLEMILKPEADSFWKFLHIAERLACVLLSCLADGGDFGILEGCMRICLA